MSYKRCTVLLREEVYQRLKEEGKFGETFSDVVERIFAELDGVRKNELRN